MFVFYLENYPEISIFDVEAPLLYRLITILGGACQPVLARPGSTALVTSKKYFSNGDSRRQIGYMPWRYAICNPFPTGTVTEEKSVRLETTVR